MRKINILLLIFISLSIISCSKGVLDEGKEEIKKQDFYIKTSNITDLPRDYILKKSWIIESSQNIILSSNAIWRVSRVDVKEWQNVKKWQILAYLEDNIWSYNLNLQKWANTLEMTKINYESTKITLDKQVFDLEINLDNLKNNLLALENDKIETLRQTQSNLDNSNIKNKDSKSYLDIEKLQNTIEKLTLDYNSKLIADKQVINGYKLSLNKEQNTLLIMMNDVIDFSDKLLWVTDNYKDEAKEIRDFLWTKDKTQKQISFEALKSLITYKENKFNSIDLNYISKENILKNLDIINFGYDKLKFLLNSLEETLNNSIESYWVLWKAEISAYIWNINLYQVTFSWNYTWFVAYNNGTSTFLKTYETSEESTKKQIDLLKQDKQILEKTFSLWNLWADVSYNKTVINYKDKITSLKSQIKIVNNNLENAKKTRVVALKNLNNSIDLAKISYNEALKQVSKLIIKSPISWVINGVYIDNGQEVNQWTKVFSIINNKIPEVKIYFDKKELSLVNIWKNIYWKNDWKIYTWSIYSISNIADNNFKYPAIINFNNWFNLIGDLLEIEIPIKTEKYFLPINIVQIVKDNIWYVNVLKDWKIKNVQLNFWEIQNDKIEIRWCITLLEKECTSLNIILNDITNYDEEKFNIVVKK